MEYEKDYEETICNFKKYVKQTLDLMVDAYKWKVMAKHCTDENIQNTYTEISNTLFNLFMREHNNISNMFKEY